MQSCSSTRVWRPRLGNEVQVPKNKRLEDDACLETKSQDMSPRDFPTRDLRPRRFGNHTWGCLKESCARAVPPRKVPYTLFVNLQMPPKQCKIGVFASKTGHKLGTDHNL